MTTLKMTTATTSTIVTIKTANYSLTFNNDVLASAKDLVTGRFVKRSIAMAEYRAEAVRKCELVMAEQAVKSLASEAVKTTVVAASKILFSASIMTTLTILFVVLFAGLFFAFFAASTGNIYVKTFLMLFIAFVSSGGIYLFIADKLIDVKKQLTKVITA